VTLTLPWPPSVNSYWRHPTRGPLAGRTLISVEGRQYRQAIASLAKVNALPMWAGRVKILIKAAPPDRRRRDLDNILKALLDALVYAGVLADDELIDDLRVLRQPPIPGGCVLMTIEEIGRG
jgi:crossover junction endodeoxyribonuclease RusA